MHWDVSNCWTGIWNGTVEWNSGMEQWNGPVEWKMKWKDHCT